MLSSCIVGGVSGGGGGAVGGGVSGSGCIAVSVRSSAPSPIIGWAVFEVTAVVVASKKLIQLLTVLLKKKEEG